MKTTIIFSLIAILTLLSFGASAQINAVNQYCYGTQGSVITPASALDNDMASYSRLKLRATSSKDYIYQNFMFSSEIDINTKIVLIIQGETNQELNKEQLRNVKFYTHQNGQINSDTLSSEEVEITKLAGEENKYEVSFYSKRNHNEAGIAIYGGGKINMMKIYKVYMAANNSPINLVSLEK